MTSVIGCKEAVRRLWDFLDDGLDDAGRDEVERHLAFCRRCCGELEFARELRQVLRGRSNPPLPGDVQHRLEGFIESLDGPEPTDGPDGRSDP